MELTLEQKRAVALAQAKRKRAGGAAAPKYVTQPNLSYLPAVGPILGALGYDGMPKEQAAGYEPSSVPFLDPINSFANKALESIPIAGPAISGAARRLDEMTYGEAPGTREKINEGDQATRPSAARSRAPWGRLRPPGRHPWVLGCLACPEACQPAS
jgi:hypothetical protein